MGDLLSAYLEYNKDTEVPAVFSRWSCIVGIGALLGRQYYLPFGSGQINPNLYAMLVGTPGTRKGTAIKSIIRILSKTGYDKFASERTSKEKFLLDLAGEETINPDDILDQRLFGDAGSDCEMFIAIDEIRDFLGSGNIDFYSMLGNMWNYEGVYKNRIKTGKSVNIKNPTINILGGTTPVNIKMDFPQEIIGQGFFSRMLLIYGEPNGKRITFPSRPDDTATKSLIEYFSVIKSKCLGPATFGSGAREKLDSIYKQYTGIDDPRFESYSQRRFDQLLKLCLVISAARCTTDISESDVIYANTILTHVEQFMPKALGEFGTAKNSSATHKVLGYISAAGRAVTLKEIWKQVSNDLEKPQLLNEILQNLAMAEKIQAVPGIGFLPKHKVVNIGEAHVNFNLLTQEEREMKK